MNDALKNILIGSAKTMIAVMELTADSSAMMSIVCALGPEVRAEFEKQRAIERDRVRGLIEEQNLMIQALQSGAPLQH